MQSACVQCTRKAEWRSCREFASEGKASWPESIHGNKNHFQRQRALRGKFKENRAQVLVATDVAARGLDIADISHVINYDIPQTYDDYVHRIGRTGGDDKQGKALYFYRISSLAKSRKYSFLHH